MKRLIRISIWSLLFLISGYNSLSQNYLSGYSKTIRGEDFSYHAPQPDAKFAMLIRSESSDQYIEWETENIPVDYNHDKIRFLMLAGLDVNPEDPHSWDVFINDKKYFTISSPLDTLNKKLTWYGPGNSNLSFITSDVDKYGDLMGYLILNLDRDFQESGESIRIKVSGDNMGSRTWFMVFKYKTHNSIKIKAENALKKDDNGNTQVLKTEIAYFGEPVHAGIIIGPYEFSKELKFGYNVHYIDIPEIRMEMAYPAYATIGGEVLYDEEITLKPVKQRTINLVHHSHVDIGYTHVQEDVKRIQMEHLEKAIDLARKTQNYPEGARFKWNIEVVWPIDSYLENASSEQLEEFQEAMQKGWIEMNALYANELTALCNSEELFELTEDSWKITNDAGVKLQSAMITDIPGWTWGLVPVLASRGVKYFSMGTNTGHRIGSVINDLGDRPFYWVSPSGEEKILAWVHQQGYSLFHTGLGFGKIEEVLSEHKVFPYLNWLEENDYPYDITVLRYSIGSDNGPPHEVLPDLVKAWNEKYVTPKIMISTMSEAFGTFEEHYGDQLPSLQGDITAYWEDGAISSARETKINRESASRLVQSQTLATILPDVDYPGDDFEEAWENVLLFDEHTWGSWNSISEPDAEFTLQQWDVKKQFVLDAEKSSKQIIFDILDKRTSKEEYVEAIEVINTSSWLRSDVVYLSNEYKLGSAFIIDNKGNSVPSQIMADGRIAFLAKNIPSMGSRIYKISDRGQGFRTPFTINNNVVENEFFRITINEDNGYIEKLIWKEYDTDLVNLTDGTGLNQYFYVEGRNPKNALTNEKVNIRIRENGPVMASLVIESAAPGAVTLEREICLYNGIDRIDLTNNIHKLKIYDPEGVHFAFPFNVPDGLIRYDLAFGLVGLEYDQLPGSNKNHFTAEYYVDVSNSDYGVTLTLPDAPLMEPGTITCDPTVYGWQDSILPTQTVYSYVMNNYWETNYLAAQEGPVSFRYSMIPHHEFDAVVSEKKGIESRQPLIVVPVTKNQTPINPDFKIEDNGIIIFAAEIIFPSGETLIKLYNSSDQNQKLNWIIRPGEIFSCDAEGNNQDKIKESLVFKPHEIRFFLYQ